MSVADCDGGLEPDSWSQSPVLAEDTLVRDSEETGANTWILFSDDDDSEQCLNAKLEWISHIFHCIETLEKVKDFYFYNSEGKCTPVYFIAKPSICTEDNKWMFCLWRGKISQ